MLGRALRKGLSYSADEQGRALMRGFLGSTPTVSGVRVSPSSAVTAAAVYGATSLRADTVASLPIRFLEKGDETRTEVFPEQARPLWNGSPNPLQTTNAFVISLVLSKLLWGQAYIYPRRTNGGDVFELWPLDPDRVEVEAVKDDRNPGTIRYRVLDFEDLVNVPGKPVKMIHIPHHTLPGRVKGLSPIEVMAELVGMSLSSQEHAARFLGDGVHMTGVIETNATAAELTPDKAKKLWEGFQMMHAGPKKAGRVGVLSGATFKTLAIPPAELQFLEQMKYSDTRIASAIYRVPPHMFGDTDKSTSWGTGIEEQTIGFVRNAILPDVRAIEEAFEAALLAGTNLQMRFNLNGLLRGNTTSRKEFYTAMWDRGVFSANDIRRMEDMPPLTDGNGDTYYVPANYLPAGTDPATIGSAGKLLLQLMNEGRVA
jgi:HK97 family phage portal protein